MEGLTLEYCIYYEQSSMTEFDAKPEVELKTLYGTIKLPEIEAKNEITVSTEPVKIYEDDINPIPRLRGDQRRPGKGEVIGICARLIFKNGDQKSVREIRKPHSLLEEEYPWTTISSPNKRPPSKT